MDRGNPFLPIPDGAFDAGDRMHLMGLYSGIAAGAPVLAIGTSSGAVQRAEWQEYAWQPHAVVTSSWSFDRLVPRRAQPLGGFS